MISKIEVNWGAEKISDPLFMDEDAHDYEDVVIITKQEAIALVKFLQTQWLDRHIEYLDDGVKRLMKGIE